MSWDDTCKDDRVVRLKCRPNLEIVVCASGPGYDTFRALAVVDVSAYATCELVADVRALAVVLVGATAVSEIVMPVHAIAAVPVIGLASVEVQGIYDPILSLNPALFVQFKYAQYGGQQVLFRDDAATDPVTDPGQHTIGAAVDLVSGAPWEKQPSAARKPLWDEGAIFDGLDDYLVGDNPIGISPRTVIAKGTVFGAQRGTLAGTRASTTHGYGMQAEANGNFRIITSVATPSGSLMLSPGWTLGDPFVVSHTYDEDLAPGDTTWLGIAGGASVSNSQIDEGEDHELLGIGGLPFTNGRDFLDGKIEAVAIWNRVLTPEEIQIIEEALL